MRYALPHLAAYRPARFLASRTPLPKGNQPLQGPDRYRSVYPVHWSDRHPGGALRKGRREKVLMDSRLSRVFFFFFFFDFFFEQSGVIWSPQQSYFKWLASKVEKKGVRPTTVCLPSDDTLCKVLILATLSHPI